MADSLLIMPASAAVHGAVRPPGSKSLTNRALIVAALADGNSRMSGVLDSQDTWVMLDSLQRLGIGVRYDATQCVAEIVGSAGRPPARSADLWLENSGTSIRFLTALGTLGRGTFRLDGNARMRQRPIRGLVNALNALGAEVACDLHTDCPPLTVNANSLPGGAAKVAGKISSQYLSGLLMVAPCADSPVELRLDGQLVSGPYVDMTIGVMSAFGVAVDVRQEGCYRIEPQKYRGIEYDVEPDASAAGYFFAAAAVTGGEVTVDGLSRGSLQGDVRFVDVLEQMGCRAKWRPHSITLSGGKLRGIDVDMNAISDTAQTLAAVAVFAEGPTRIRNVAHIRHKETDRIAAVVTELRRLGLVVDEHPDGMTIHPGPIQPATIHTYDDHRMAMSFALLGLRTPGVWISDPGCTAKTYPHYFDDLQSLCGTKP